MPMQPKTVANTLIGSILQGDAAPASVFKMTAISAEPERRRWPPLSPEKLRRTRERRGLSRHGHAGVPAELVRHTMKRFNFVLGAVSGLAVVANSDHVFAQALAQSPLPGLPGGQNRCLVLVNLNGGNDGLNCIVPHGDPQYYQLRPSLAIPAQRRARDRCQARFQSGDAVDQSPVRQGHGRDRPRRRISRTPIIRISARREIWQTGVPERYEHTGWLGRYLDEAALPESNLFKGVAVSQVLPEALVATRTDIPAISNSANTV